MVKWFNSQNRLIQVILLLLPVVNWVIELLVRWSKFLDTKKGGHLLMALVVTFLGLPIGFIDAIWCLLTGHMIFAK